MHFYKKAVFAAVLVTGLATSSAMAEDKFPGVKALMNDAEFTETGLEKLSPEELKALDAWLVRYTAGDAEVLQASNEEVKKAQKEHEVLARITGDFKGWQGKTIFRLDNGQVWVQRLDGRYAYKGSPNPEVRIKRNWAGFYRMTIVETGKSIGVSPMTE